MYDVIIIGNGPAGLTSALYTGRAKLRVLLIEGISVQSQAVTTDFIENYPGFPDGISGPDLIERIKKQIKKLDIEFLSGDVQSIKNINNGWQISLDDKKLDALSLIIATGARPKKLEVLGEEKFCGKGISYCATCDGAFFKDRDIVVVGGGDTAIEETLFLTRFAKTIKLIHRRDRLRATKILQERVFNNKKIEFVWDSIVKEILGKDRVTGVEIKNVKTNRESTISCDGVFIFAGFLPNTEFLKGVVDLDKDGYIITDENMQTSKKGVFACGDCRQKSLRQIITACGDGAIAAYNCQGYIEELKGMAYDSGKIV